MKHTPGPVAVSNDMGAYPICACPHDEYGKLTWFVNAGGPVRELPEEDSRFIAWCYNHADEFLEVFMMIEGEIPQVDDAVVISRSAYRRLCAVVNNAVADGILHNGD